MTRVGPNQDMNDPRSLDNVHSLANTASRLAQSKSEESDDIPLTDTPAVPTPVALVLSNGQTVLVPGGNPVAWDSALIQTYINQPERFRRYWREINSFAATIESGELEDVYSFDLGPSDCDTTTSTQRTEDDFSVVPGVFANTVRSIIINCDIPLLIDMSGTLLGGAEYNPLDEPTWTGHGPTDYNSGTWPQLSDAFNNLNTQLNNITIPVPASSTNPFNLRFAYHEDSAYREYDNPAPSRLSRIGVNQTLNTGIDGIFILFYNPTKDDIELVVTYELTVTPGDPVDFDHNARRTIVVGVENQISKNTASGDTHQEVYSLGGTWQSSVVVIVPSKTLKQFDIPFGFATHANAAWDRPEDRIPENALNSNLCGLNWKVTVQGILDNIVFTPSVSM